MIVSIFKFVLFLIIICSFEYAPNELYFINETSKYLERNIINFINNRVLADADKIFDLNNFYESTFSLANQFNDCNDDDEEITNLRNAIDSHIKSHKESNTLPNLNNVDRKTKKLIYELQKELEEVKKDINNIRDAKIATQPIQEKRIIKMDENVSVSNHEGNISEMRHNGVNSSNNNVLNNILNLQKEEKKLVKTLLLLIVSFFVILGSGVMKLLVLLVPFGFFIYKSCRKISKYRSKLGIP
ncbi:fam-b protein [Plasmodium vinckei brucechwatti]|uniref:Fam-b protein n=1 Tax=Plasmodium vinckei brucechwatti TaxID=119398 RepID=A0A6V7SUV3_PLAVN|nr:fam-b protein [Plasmodium vinckei brucechwatti]